MNNDILKIGFGVLLGAAAVGIAFWLKKKFQKEAALQKEKEIQDIIEKLKGSFASLSLEALSKNSEEFLRLAHQRLSAATESGEQALEGKKKLIDQTLEAIKSELDGVEQLMRQLEKDREGKFSELSTNLRTAAEATSRLQQTAEQLKSVLASTKSRGQLGEKITEDILRLAGFLEGVNYIKQKAQGIGRPDYTFLLPQNIRVNMDVKFPLDNYRRFMEAESDMEREKHRKEFLSDARQRIKEVTTREYIDPEHKTVDFVIVFVPLEQAYAFINENDSKIFDEALQKKVIFCSPLTLYAILAIIRQAVEIFNLSRTTDAILLLLGSFKKQWEAFIDSFSELGRRIEGVSKEYDTLVTTRRNQLDRQLKKVDDLRVEKGITLEREGGEAKLLDFEKEEL